MFTKEADELGPIGPHLATVVGRGARGVLDPVRNLGERLERPCLGLNILEKDGVRVFALALALAVAIR